MLIAVDMPPLDAMYWLLLVSRILHVVYAAVLVGGLYYIHRVVLPAVDKGETSADALFGGRRAVWAMWVGVATLFLLATGLLNFIMMVRAYEFAGPYHMLFGIKFLLAMIVFALAALLAGKTSAAEKMRQRFRLWLSVCLTLGVVVIMLGSVLRSIPREPKIEEAAAAADLSLDATCSASALQRGSSLDG